MKLERVVGCLALSVFVGAAIACSTPASAIAPVEDPDGAADGGSEIPDASTPDSAVDATAADASSPDAKADATSDASQDSSSVDGSVDAASSTCAFDVNSEAKVCVAGYVKTKADWAQYAGCTHLTGTLSVYPTEVDTLSAMPTSIVLIDAMIVKAPPIGAIDAAISGMPENMHIVRLDLHHSLATKFALPKCMKVDGFTIYLPKATFGDAELQQICNASVDGVDLDTGVKFYSTTLLSSCAFQLWLSKHKGCERRAYYKEASSGCMDVTASPTTCSATAESACQGNYLIDCSSRLAVAYCANGCVAAGDEATCVLRSGAPCGTLDPCEGTDGACLAGKCGTSPVETNCTAKALGGKCLGDTAVQCHYAGYPFIRDCPTGKCKDGWCTN